MHLNSEDILRLLDQKHDKDRVKYVEKHLSVCEYCQELYDHIVLTHEKYKEFIKQDYSNEWNAIQGKMKNHQLITQIIPLKLLSTISDYSTPHLAADGIQNQKIPLQILSTFYSEDPEVILKLIKDDNLNEDYILVISENNQIMSNVLVELPDLGKHFITDNKGKAIVFGYEIDDLIREKWQVKLPDAVFELKPFEYNKDKTEDSSEVILTTKNNDRLKVIFEEKTEGNNIKLQLIELNGKKNLDNLKISIIQDDYVVVEKVNSHSIVSFNLKKGSDGINIRIFT